MVNRRVNTRLNAIRTSINMGWAPSNFSISNRVFKIIRRRIKFSNGPDVTSLQMWYLKTNMDQNYLI